MRNLLTNGGFEFDQANEGALITIPSTNGAAYFADGMWVGSNVNVSNGAVVTVQRCEGTGSDAQFSAKLTVVTPASSVQSNDRLRIHNIIGTEDGNAVEYGTQFAKTTSLSFWVKSSHAGTYAHDIANHDGSRCLYNHFTINAADTWQYVTFDNIPGCTDGTWNRGETDIWGWHVFWATMGSDYVDSVNTTNTWRPAHVGSGTTLSNHILVNAGAYLQIKDVNWTPTATAQPFIRDPLEILRCKLRYQKSYNQGIIPGASGTAPAAYKGSGYRYYNVTGGAAFNATGMDVRYPIPMVGTPVVTLYSPITGAVGNIRNFNGSDCAATVYTSGHEGFTMFNQGTLLTPLSVLYHFTADSRVIL